MRSLPKISLLAAVICASAVQAQDFQAEPQDGNGSYTTATEIKAILPHTKAGWIGVRRYDGNDLIYFTNLLMWRCGMHQIKYGLNGEEMKVLEMEPCYDDEAAPNNLKIDGAILPFDTYGLDTIKTIELEILYDDMSTESASFERDAVHIP